MSPPPSDDERAYCERLAVGVYRALLLILPGDFRREHGAECVALFRRTLRDAQATAGRTGAVRAAWRGWMGVMKAAGEEARRTSIPDTLLRETHHALRRLLRAPGVTAPAVLTLALAVGAVAAVFTVARGVVLSPLPYPDSERLIALEHGLRGLDLAGALGMTEGFFIQYRERASTLEGIAIHRSTTLTVTGRGEPARIPVLRTTPSLSRVLRVSPRLGRWITEDEGAMGAPPVAVLSHGFWQRRYGADPNVLGRTITLSDRDYEIVGVMPAGFAYPERVRPDAWISLPIRESNIQVSGFNFIGVGRLGEGATLAAAAAELDDLIAQLPERFPSDAFGVPFIEEAQPFALPRTLKDAVVGSVEGTLWILLGAAAVVLLVACAKVANLFLVRAEGRHGEMAVRRALGAGRAGVSGLLVSESVLISLLGGAAGLALAALGVKLLVAFGPPDLPRLHEVRIDALVVAFTAGVSVLGGLALGSVPLVRSPRLSSSLNEGGRGGTATRARMRARHALMAAQVGLSLVLLVTAGLMAKSFGRLLDVDPGFAEEGVLAVGVSLPSIRYPTREEAAAFHDRLLERVRALPGVLSASATTCPPLAGTCWGDPVGVEGRAPSEGEIPPVVSRRRVADDYFETLGMSPLAGRVFGSEDHRTSTGVAVVDERLAQLYFPGEDPIGRRVALNGWTDVPNPDWYEVIGIVPHVVTHGLTSTDRPPQIYLPLVSHSTNGTPNPHVVDMLVHTSTSPLDLVPAVRGALAEMDPAIPLGDITTLEEVLERDRAPMAFTMVLILIAGAASLALGLVGIYGVLAYAVSQRTGEIGVRVAMGASPRDIARMVLRQGATVAVVGLAVGLAAALSVSRALESLLFEVSPTEPTTYTAAALGLLLAALLACWLPARRAARLDPVVALRTE